MFLSVGFFALFWVFGNLDYSTVFSLSPFMNESALTMIGLLLMLAAMGKSAQLGLHTWLPDAMEGWNDICTLTLVALWALALITIDSSLSMTILDQSEVAENSYYMINIIPCSYTLPALWLPSRLSLNQRAGLGLVIKK